MLGWTRLLEMAASITACHKKAVKTCGLISHKVDPQNSHIMQTHIPIASKQAGCWYPTIWERTKRTRPRMLVQTLTIFSLFSDQAMLEGRIMVLMATTFALKEHCWPWMDSWAGRSDHCQQDKWAGIEAFKLKYRYEYSTTAGNITGRLQ